MRRLRAAAVMMAAGALAALLAGGPAASQTPAAPPAGVDPALLQELATGSRILADLGVVDAFGHISVRHPTRPDRFLMARSLAPALVTAADVMEFDLDGKPTDPQGRTIFLERFIHAEIYRARPDVQSVVHSHSLNVIPFSVSSVPLRAMYHNTALI